MKLVWKQSFTRLKNRMIAFRVSSKEYLTLKSLSAAEEGRRKRSLEKGLAKMKDTILKISPHVTKSTRG
jgi:hypothetical protein